MTFGQILDEIKNGGKFSRKAWNNAYIYYVKANNYPAQTDVAKEEFGDMVPYNEYIAFKSTKGSIECGWRPDTTDMFETDWNTNE